MTEGKSVTAVRVYTTAQTAAAAALAADPGNTTLQRDVSVSYNKIGDVPAAQGDSAVSVLAFHP